MAYTPTDNTPRHTFFEMDSEDDALEIVAPPDPPEPPVLEERPDSEDGFASMVAETLRGLTSDQRVYAQREIIKVLNQSRYIGTAASQNPRELSGQNNAGQSTSRVEEAPLASQGPQNQYQPINTGLMYDRYGIEYSPQRGADNRNVSGQDVRAVVEDNNSDIEWGFTPENSLSP